MVQTYLVRLYSRAGALVYVPAVLCCGLVITNALHLGRLFDAVHRPVSCVTRRLNLGGSRRCFHRCGRCLGSRLLFLLLLLLQPYPNGVAESLVGCARLGLER